MSTPNAPDGPVPPEHPLTRHEIQQQRRAGSSRGGGRGRRVLVIVVVLALVAAAAVAAVLVLSSGDETKTVTVPDVVGATQADATKALTAAGLDRGSVTVAPSDQIATGSVSAQTPKAGAEADEGSAVDLVVSSGPVTVQVPDVKGTSEADAIATLQAARLGARPVHLYNESVPAGTVVGQAPDAGTAVARASVVAIGVSAGPPPADTVTVPSVVGQAEAAATQALQDAGLGAALVRIQSATVAAGTVVAQAPAADAEVAPDTDVAVFVSTGPPPAKPTTVTVPDLAGKSAADATAALDATGLSAVAYEACDTAPADTVFGQFPASGTTVLQGNPVLVAISRGAPPECDGVTVPEIAAGTAAADAVAQVEGLGLVAEVVVSDAVSGQAGTVSAQFPAAGTVVPKGAVVGLVTPGPA